MIKKTYSKYLPFLASEKNILLLSDINYISFDNISALFNSAVHHNMQTEELETVTATLLHHKIDIALLDSTVNVAAARKFFDAMRLFDPKIVIILITSMDADKDVMSLIRDANATIFTPFTQDDLNDKLFANLGLFYIVRSIGRRDIRLKKSSKQLETLSIFLDQYEGSSLFIIDELMEISESLTAGELSKTVLDSTVKVLHEISVIFDKNSETSSVSPVIKELADFLENLDIGSLKPSALKAFDYLAATIDDLSHILTDMFVDRLVKDVHVFQDSLQSNIVFMENVFLSKNNDSGTIEFIND